MFRKRSISNRSHLKATYDQKLLDALASAMQDWNRSKAAVDTVAEVDGEMLNQRQVARAKYLFLYREARRRGTRNTRIMPGTEHDFLS